MENRPVGKDFWKREGSLENMWRRRGKRRKEAQESKKKKTNV